MVAENRPDQKRRKVGMAHHEEADDRQPDHFLYLVPRDFLPPLVHECDGVSRHCSVAENKALAESICGDETVKNVRKKVLGDLH
jgi:hypothetical protein